MEERRKSQRFKVAEGITGHIKPTMAVRVLDISQHGILLETPSGLPPDGVCEVTVDVPSGKKKIRARVARCRAHMVKGKGGAVTIKFHAGLEFMEDFAEGTEVRDLMNEICVVDDMAATQPIRVGTLKQAM
jgi:hypothetical protein